MAFTPKTWQCGETITANGHTYSSSNDYGFPAYSDGTSGGGGGGELN